MKCFVCSEKLNEGYICDKCLYLLDKMLDTKSNILVNPQWLNHCLICGEYTERTIIDVPNCGPICDKCILEAKHAVAKNKEKCVNNIIDKINSSGWADWSLDKFEVDYETVRITISNEPYAGPLTICCKDYIGFSFIGHWDESVIADINIEMHGRFVEESLQVVKNLYGESPLLGGGVKHIDDKWYQLNIKLIDGNIIKVACKNLNIE